MNIYVITGLSSNEWKKQTKERLPQILENNIFHRNQLKEFMESIKDKKNILVLMDEVQIWNKNKQFQNNSKNVVY